RAHRVDQLRELGARGFLLGECPLRADRLPLDLERHGGIAESATFVDLDLLEHRDVSADGPVEAVAERLHHLAIESQDSAAAHERDRALGHQELSTFGDAERTASIRPVSFGSASSSSLKNANSGEFAPRNLK